MVREYLKRETERAGFGGVDIQRTPMGTRITLVAERPGFVIGRRGATIKKLTEDLTHHFKLDNPQIEVQESPNPSLNAQIMSQKLAEAMERGWHFRRAGHSTLRRIMDAGAKGCIIVISGKLSGQRSRTEKFIAGHIKHCGETAIQFMGKGQATARKKLGAIGVKVSIMAPDARMPDEITVKEPGVVEPGAVAPAAPESTSPAPEAEATGPIAKAEKMVDIEGIGAKKAKALEDAGFSDVDSLMSATEDDLAKVEGIGPKLAKKIKGELGRMER